MSDTSTVDEAIRDWAMAQKAFRDEPNETFANALQATERDLFSRCSPCHGPLDRLLRAVADRGCGMCWATHSGQNVIGHGECNKKIAFYYIAKEELILYGSKL